MHMKSAEGTAHALTITANRDLSSGRRVSALSGLGERVVMLIGLHRAHCRGESGLYCRWCWQRTRCSPHYRSWPLRS